MNRFCLTKNWNKCGHLEHKVEKNLYNLQIVLLIMEASFGGGGASPLLPLKSLGVSHNWNIVSQYEIGVRQ